MKNSLKIIAILIIALSLTSCRVSREKVSYAATESTKTVETLAEDTSSAKAPSRPSEQALESEEQASEKPQEKPQQEAKHEEISSAAESSDPSEYLKVESREYMELEEEVIRLMNEQRRAVGLKPLRVCDIYYNCVKRRARECTQYWSHTRPDGRKYASIYTDLPFNLDFKMLSENLGKKFVSAQQIVTALMNSEPHRRNILSPEYTDVCVAIVMMDQSEQVYSKTIYAMAQHFYKREEL